MTLQVGNFLKGFWYCCIPRQVTQWPYVRCWRNTPYFQCLSMPKGIYLYLWLIGQFDNPMWLKTSHQRMYDWHSPVFPKTRLPKFFSFCNLPLFEQLGADFTEKSKVYFLALATYVLPLAVSTEIYASFNFGKSILLFPCQVSHPQPHPCLPTRPANSKTALQHQ